jgi:hypothetical protein
MSAILGVLLLHPQPEAAMRTELSPEEMRSPLRRIVVTGPVGSRETLIDELPVFAEQNRFVIRLSGDPASPGDTYVQIYRSDIKMIGRITAGETRLDLGMYRTSGRMPANFINGGVNGLRSAIDRLPGMRFEQTVFVSGDDMALEPRTGRKAARSATIHIPDHARSAVRQKLAGFADLNGLAMGFREPLIDQKEIAFDAYADGIKFLGFSPVSSSELIVFIDRIGDRSVSDTMINHFFNELRRAVEQIDGVTFKDR